MKIVFAGGGTGGHFYPIIAVAEALLQLSQGEKIGVPDMYYMSDDPFDADTLAKDRLIYINCPAGKLRTYFSPMNFLDAFKTLWGCIVATWELFILYPDVVFGKGGYASFPAMFAARLLRIPVVIHESDIVPGRVNRWVANYAQKIAISYPEAAERFKQKSRIALTGQPVRADLFEVPPDDPAQTFGLEPGIPVILVLGGSQGSERINENIIDILPRLLERYQIIHQTGEANLEWMKTRASSAFGNHPHIGRYRPVGFLDGLQLRLAAKAASLVISRAGSAIFEIAIWGRPSILIPLAIARDDHQRENAYSYARTGAATVIEEKNLKPELFFSVIESIMENEERRTRMAEGSKQFAKTDAAEKIARVILSIASHHD